MANNQKYVLKLNDETSSYVIYIAADPDGPGAMSLQEARTAAREHATARYHEWRRQVHDANESRHSIEQRSPQ